MFRSRTILLAEPDASLRDAWRRGLTAMGFHVAESSTAPAAMAIAMRSEVALLITELYLPTDTDRCLVRAVRHERALKRLKILVVSHHDGERDRQWALAEGADAYLAKPAAVVGLLQLAARLATVRQRSRGELRDARSPSGA